MGDDGVWAQALQKLEPREEMESMVVALGRVCCAITHCPAQCWAAKQPEPGTGIVAFEVNVATRLLLCHPLSQHWPLL